MERATQTTYDGEGVGMLEPMVFKMLDLVTKTASNSKVRKKIADIMGTMTERILCVLQDTFEETEAALGKYPDISNRDRHKLIIATLSRSVIVTNAVIENELNLVAQSITEDLHKKLSGNVDARWFVDLLEKIMDGSLDTRENFGADDDLLSRLRSDWKA
jgi:hypothetical protein